ncbi:hypothetical protein B566_EDAN000992, partial [Ephemera danica]
MSSFRGSAKVSSRKNKTIPTALFRVLEVIKSHLWLRRRCTALINPPAADLTVSPMERSYAKELETILYDPKNRDTLHLVLQGEWPTLSGAIKTHLTVTIKRCAATLGEHPCAVQYHSLVEVIQEPWGHPSFNRIFKSEEAIGDKEAIDFCNAENSLLLIMRLEVLTGAKCEDIALKLARIYARCLRLPGSSLHVECSPEHRNELIDFYVLSYMTLQQGLKLIQRHAEHSTNSRLWKHNTKIALLETCFFMNRAFSQAEEVENPSLQKIIKLWATLHQKIKTSQENLSTAIKNFAANARPTLHIYNLCNTLLKQLDGNFKPLFIEMFIQGLTIDLNVNEQNKLESDKEKVKEYEIRLANGFLQLAVLLEDNVGVSRECLLTAFSLHPTEETFLKLENIALACGKKLPTKRKLRSKSNSVDSDDVCESCRNCDANASNDLANGMPGSSKASRNSVSEKCRVECDSTTDTTSTRAKSPKECEASTSSLSNVTKSKPDSKVHKCKKCGNSNDKSTGSAVHTLDAIVSITGDRVTQALNYDVLNAPNQVLDAEQLGVTQALCDDLAVIISSPRWHILSWVLEWYELEPLCKKYLADPEGTRYVIKELKHVEVDYELFKHLPSVEIHEYYGIEEGYEHLLNEGTSVAKSKTGATRGRKRATKATRTTKTVKVKATTPRVNQRGRNKRVVKIPVPFGSFDLYELPANKKKQASKPIPKISKSKKIPKAQLPKKSRRKSTEVQPSAEADCEENAAGEENEESAVCEEMEESTISDENEESSQCSDGKQSDQEPDKSKPKFLVNSKSPGAKKIYESIIQGKKRRVSGKKNKSNFSSQASVYSSGFNPDFEFTYILNRSDTSDNDEVSYTGFPFFVRLPSRTPVAVVAPSGSLNSSFSSQSSVHDSSTGHRAVPGLIPLSHVTPATSSCTPQSTPPQSPSLTDSMFSAEDLNRSFTSDAGSTAESTTSDPATIRRLRQFRPSGSESPKKSAPSLSEIDLHPTIVLDKLEEAVPSNVSSMAGYKKQLSSSGKKIRLKKSVDTIKGMKSDIYDGPKQHVNFLSAVPGMTTFDYVQPRGTNSVVQIAHLSDRAETSTSNNSAGSSSNTTALQVSGTNSSSSSIEEQPTTSFASVTSTTSVVHHTASATPQQSSSQSSQQASAAIKQPPTAVQVQLVANTPISSTATSLPVVASTSAGPRKNAQTTVSVPMSVANISMLPTVSGRQLANSPVVPKSDYSNKGAQAKNNSNNSKVQNPRNAPVQGASTSVARIMVANTNSPAAAAAAAGAAAKRPSQGLPKFQQAFGKPIPVYQSGEAASSAVPNAALIQPNAAVGKTVQTAVVGNLQPQQLKYAALPIFVSSVGSRIITSPPAIARRTAPVNIANQVAAAAAAAALGSGLPRQTLTTAAAAALGSGLPRQTLASAAAAAVATSNRFAPTLIPGGLAKPRAETSIQQIKNDVMNKMKLANQTQN